MVIPLGPGKFYGSSLPRPRFHKVDADRVSPPVPVLDPLLSWANEAHWSMGGLSFQRLRLQGRIEGSVKKLRAEREKTFRAKAKILKNKPKALDLKASKPQSGDSRKRAGSVSVSPPPAPVATKRRRYMALVDDSEEEEEHEAEESEVRVEKRRPARKLYEEFDRVAKENEKAKSKGSDAVLLRMRVKKGGDGVGDEVMKVVEDVNREVVEEVLGKKNVKKSDGGAKRVSPRSAAKGVETSPGAAATAAATRTSPRLAKRG